MKPTYMQSYETPYPGYGTDNGGWENSNQKTVVREAPVPELPDLNSFSQFCCKKAFEDVAGWMGCILERQVSFYQLVSVLRDQTPSPPRVRIEIGSDE